MRSNIFRTEYDLVNLDQLEALFDKGATVTVEALRERGIVSSRTALVKVLRMKTTRDSFARFGADVLESSPEEFSRFIRDDLAKWSKVIRDAGIKLE